MKARQAFPRIVVSIGIAVLTAGALSGCSPEPEPSPTPTAAFASEEEAFAAAEQVYREYNDAGNARLRGDKEPDPTQYLVGTALEDDLSGQELLRESGLQLTGEIALAEFLRRSVAMDGTAVDVLAVVCLDTSGTQVVNREGADVTPANRPMIVAQEVALTYTTNSFLIIRQSETEANTCSLH